MGVFNGGVKPFIENSSEHKHINYTNVPVKSLYELRRLTEKVENILTDIKIPTLLVFADEDPVVQFESAALLMDKLGSEDKKLITIHSNRHGFLMENRDDTWNSINGFLQQTVLDN